MVHKKSNVCIQISSVIYGCNFMKIHEFVYRKNKYLHVNIYTLIHYSSEMVMTMLMMRVLCSFIRLTKPKPKPNISKVKYIKTMHRHREILKCLAQFDRKHTHTHARTHTAENGKGIKNDMFLNIFTPQSKCLLRSMHVTLLQSQTVSNISSERLISLRISILHICLAWHACMYKHDR